jgi:trehalose 6-phosphate synthase
MMNHHDLTWVVGAITDADRELVSFGERRLRFVGAPPAMYDLFYGVFCNPVLWFLQHSIWHLLDGRPDLEKDIVQSWEHGYLPVNQAFADAVVDEVKGANGAPRVMLHDYHLYVAPLFIRHRCPGVSLQHFTHIPWPGPETWSVLPQAIVESICEGMLANDSVAFQTEQSKRDFLRTCLKYLPGVSVDAAGTALRYRGRTVRAFANPVSVDVPDLRRQLASPGVALYRAALADDAGLATIVRVDRLDPAKNILGGFQAFDMLLNRHPEWIERVRFLAFLVPSRDSILEYRRYRDEVFALIEDINHRYGNRYWQPISVFYEQDRPQALAGLSLYDVLLTNSLADGMNLVAKEGPILNQRDGVVVLSRGVGAYQELGEAALGVEAGDIEGTAETLQRALTMTPEERRERAAAMRQIITHHDIDDWAKIQLAAFERGETKAVAHPVGWRPAGLRRRLAFRVAQFAAAAALVFSIGFGAFAVSTSADALPGDWRYPIKRTVEDVRYTLTLTEGGKKQLDMEYAKERLSEVQRLAEKGRPIGEGPLRDMASKMDSLVGRLDNGQLDSKDAQKVQELAQQQQAVLDNVAPMVKAEAADELTQAKSISTDALVRATDYVKNPPQHNKTPAPPRTTATATVGPATPTPSEPQATPIPAAVVIVPLPDEHDAGLTWELATFDGLSVEAPSQASGWRLTLGPDRMVETPLTVRVANQDASATVVIDPRSGDAYWRQLFSDGQVREYKVRTSSGGISWQASESELSAFYPGNAAIVWHIIGSIKIQPPPTPSPSPTATPTRTAEVVTPAVTP